MVVSRLSPISTAPGRQRSASHRRMDGALSALCSNPRLCPSSSIASNRSPASRPGSPMAPRIASSPRRRHVSTAPSEMSTAVTSQPRCSSRLAWRPPPAPRSSTRPRTASSARRAAGAHDSAPFRYSAAMYSSRHPSSRSTASGSDTPSSASMRARPNVSPASRCVPEGAVPPIDIGLSRPLTARRPRSSGARCRARGRSRPRRRGGSRCRGRTAARRAPRRRRGSSWEPATRRSSLSASNEVIGVR